MFYRDTKTEAVGDILKRLTFRMLIPATVALIAYNVVILRIFNVFGVPIPPAEPGVRSFLAALLFGSQLAAAYWFIGAYTIVYLYFAVIHRRLHSLACRYVESERLVRFAFCALYLLLSALSVYFSTLLYGNTADADRNQVVAQHRPLIVALRFLFATFFYYLGFVLMQQNALRTVNIKAAAVIVTTILTLSGIIFYNYNVFFSMQIMSFPNAVTPIITSLLGIAIFYILSSVIAGSELEKALSFVGASSFSILLSHMFGFFVLNVLLAVLGFIQLGDISSAYFRFREYYMYPLYIFAGIGVSIAIPILLEKARELLLPSKANRPATK